MVPLILGQVWGKGKWLGGKSLFLSELGFVVFFFFLVFFPPIWKQKYSWVFRDQKHVGGFFWTRAGQIPFSRKENAGALCKESKRLLKKQDKNPGFKINPPGCRSVQIPGKGGVSRRAGSWRSHARRCCLWESRAHGGQPKAQT